MREPPARRTEAFIVRLWAEYLKQTPPVWRGEVVHVGEKEVVHFRHLDEIGECIRRCVLAKQRDLQQEEQ